jgi:hypothetical protein
MRHVDERGLSGSLFLAPDGDGPYADVSKIVRGYGRDLEWPLARDWELAQERSLGVGQAERHSIDEELDADDSGS